jgi:DegV family protein with EDD domain
MKIVTDSAADMPVEELEALGVTVAPLFIQFPEGGVSSADLTPDEFYARLLDMHPAIPTTAMPGTNLLAGIYRELGAGGDEILSIHISSGLSGTEGVARLAAREVAPEPEVHVWDTMTLAGGQRYQVLAAAWAARLGWDLAAIQERLAKIQAQTEVAFTLETLEYLARGGRIGRVQALAGTLLRVKPVIHVSHDDGKYSTVAKGRTLPQAMQVLVDHLHSLYGSTGLWVAVQHGQFADKAEALRQGLLGRLNVQKMEMLRVSPVLGVHTGPGIVGVAAVPAALLEDLQVAA